MICEVRLELEAESSGLEGVRRGGGRSRGGERDRELISGAMGLGGGQREGGDIQGFGCLEWSRHK